MFFFINNDFFTFWLHDHLAALVVFFFELFLFLYIADSINSLSAFILFQLLLCILSLSLFLFRVVLYYISFLFIHSFDCDSLRAICLNVIIAF